MKDYDPVGLYSMEVLAKRLLELTPEDRKDADDYLLTKDEVAFVDHGPRVVLDLMRHLRMLLAGREELEDLLVMYEEEE